MNVYPDISTEPSAPSAPGFIVDDHQKGSAGSYQPPPPYSDLPNYGPMSGNQYPPHQGPSQQNPSEVVTQPISTVSVTVIMDKFPSKSINMKCFFCHEDIKTVAEPKANICTWLLCSLLCFIGCFCGCCLIPFCTTGSRDILHYCPKCHKYLGSHERFRFR